MASIRFLECLKLIIILIRSLKKRRQEYEIESLFFNFFDDVTLRLHDYVGQLASLLIIRYLDDITLFYGSLGYNLSNMLLNRRGSMIFLSIIDVFLSVLSVTLRVGLHSVVP